MPTGAGELKTWKSEKLTRWPGFQNFRISPTPEILPNERRWSGAVSDLNVRSMHNRTFRDGIYKQ